MSAPLATQAVDAIRNAAQSNGLIVQDGYTRERVDLIKRTLCQDLTDDELQLFVGQCRRTGLDPFSKQIHATKRKGKLVIQIGIDGFRLIAERTGERDGEDGPFWLGEDGAWRDVWTDDKLYPVAAKVTVHRKGHSRGYAGIAHWAEYYVKDDRTDFMWRKMPAGQLAKCAESLALRKAFPLELGGLYVPEEFGGSEAAPGEPQSQPNPRPEQGKPQPANPQHQGKGEAVKAPDYKEFQAEVNRLRISWKDVIDWVNREFAAKYAIDTPFSKIKPDHLAEAFAALKKEPTPERAKKPAEKPAPVEPTRDQLCAKLIAEGQAFYAAGFGNWLDANFNIPADGHLDTLKQSPAGVLKDIQALLDCEKEQGEVPQ